MSFASLAAWGLRRGSGAGPSRGRAGGRGRGALQGRSRCRGALRRGRGRGRGGRGTTLLAVRPGCGAWRGRPLMTAVTGLPVRVYWGLPKRWRVGVLRGTPTGGARCLPCSSGGSPVMAGSTPVRSSVGDAAVEPALVAVPVRSVSVPVRPIRSRGHLARSGSDRRLWGRRDSHPGAARSIRNRHRQARTGSDRLHWDGLPRPASPPWDHVPRPAPRSGLPLPWAPFSPGGSPCAGRPGPPGAGRSDPGSRGAAAREHARRPRPRPRP